VVIGPGRTVEAGKRIQESSIHRGFLHTHEREAMRGKDTSEEGREEKERGALAQIDKKVASARVGGFSG